MALGRVLQTRPTFEYFICLFFHISCFLTADVVVYMTCDSIVTYKCVSDQSLSFYLQHAYAIMCLLLGNHILPKVEYNETFCCQCTIATYRFFASRSKKNQQTRIFQIVITTRRGRIVFQNNVIPLGVGTKHINSCRVDTILKH